MLHGEKRESPREKRDREIERQRTKKEREIERSKTAVCVSGRKMKRQERRGVYPAHYDMLLMVPILFLSKEKEIEKEAELERSQASTTVGLWPPKFLLPSTDDALLQSEFSFFAFFVFRFL